MATEIRIILADAVLTGTLNDSKAAREFAAMLPLTLTLEDYGSTEKISNLPHRLTRDGAPAGYAPSAGDITFYSPWGNLAVFYHDFHYSAGLIPLGRIEAGVEALRQPGAITARIELEVE
ncbi:cyclophilin-like fold protein [Indioceanicola profundi]|uniref:cyclophilin-like fold protein n=1 Tax=Indioceanicola profundi TaxID=2220096 RepID=UPI000E6A9B86|nr:cyclophilin-like fold protein [Indioceanicola profundi]